MNINKGNISFLLVDSIQELQPNNINQLMNDFQNINYKNDYFEENELYKELSIFYSDKSVNQLLKICDYYNLTKYIKMSKYKKNEIVNAIILFEMDSINNITVTKRQKLWYYMEELINDKYMKTYIIWS